MIRLSKVVFLLIIGVLAACGDTKKEDKEDKMDSRGEIRLKQYRVQGANVYSVYCANCHQQNGKGLAALYPPLAGSDYLLENLPRAGCIIKNGQFKKIEVNGVKYNQMMPGNPITNLEIAQVLTFIGNAWGNEAGLVGVKDVDKWMDECEDNF